MRDRQPFALLTPILVLLWAGAGLSGCPHDRADDSPPQGDSEPSSGPDVPPFDEGHVCAEDLACASGFCNLFTTSCASATCGADAICADGLACRSGTCDYAQACATDAECGDGVVCRRTGVPFGACAAACVAPAAEGDLCVLTDDAGNPCQFFETSCAAGLECVDAPGFSLGAVHRCVSPGDIGARCGSSSTATDGCMDGLVCQLTQLVEFVEGTCQPAAGDGAPCERFQAGDTVFFHACATGLACTAVTRDDGDVRETSCEAG